MAQDARLRGRRRRPAEDGAASRWSAPTRSRCRASASTSGCSATRSPRRPAGRLRAGAAKPRRAERKGARRARGGGGDTLASPLQGNVFKVLVEQGATVEEGALICIIEAMKMENEITAHKAGVVAELPISEGAAVRAGDTLAVIKPPAERAHAPGRATLVALRRRHDARGRRDRARVQARRGRPGRADDHRPRRDPAARARRSRRPPRRGTRSARRIAARGGRDGPARGSRAIVTAGRAAPRAAALARLT